MCGCSGGSPFKGYTTPCRRKRSRLKKSLTKISILLNIETDIDLVEKYKEDKQYIESILKEIAVSGSSPDSTTVVLIETEVNNEYTKYYNT